VTQYGTPFKDLVRRLGGHRISGLPVVDEGDRVLGVVSETDLMLRQATEPTRQSWIAGLRRLRHDVRVTTVMRHARTAGGVMTAPAVTVLADATVSEAARLMAARRVERLPVVDEEGRLVGIVTRHDLLRVFLRSDEEIRRAVQEEVLGETLWLAPHTIHVSVTGRGRDTHRSTGAAAVRSPSRSA
jgi:CBS domain-containing protein